MYQTYINIDYRKAAVGITIAIVLATMLFAAMPVALAIVDPVAALECTGANDASGNAAGGEPAESTIVNNNPHFDPPLPARGAANAFNDNTTCASEE